MNANLRNFALWVIIVLLLLALFTLFQNPGTAHHLAGHFVLAAAERGRSGPRARRPDPGTGNPRHLHRRPQLPDLCAERSDAWCSGSTARASRSPRGRSSDNVPWFVSLLVSWLPFIALIGVWIFLSRQMQGAGGKALGFGKIARQAADRGARPRHLRGRRRRRRGQAGSAGDRRIPARSRQIPAARRHAFRAACCWSARPAPARR